MTEDRKGNGRKEGAFSVTLVAEARTFDDGLTLRSTDYSPIDLKLFVATNPSSCFCLTHSDGTFNISLGTLVSPFGFLSSL
jgi:hypothetical protein